MSFSVARFRVFFTALIVMTAVVLVSAGMASAAAQENKSESEVTNESDESGDETGVAVDGDSAPASETSVESAEPSDQLPGFTTADDPAYIAEVERRTEVFQQAKADLRDAILEQRTLYMRYVNHEDRTPSSREAYTAKRIEVIKKMDDTYMAALDLTRITGDQEAATYLVTMIDHRFKRDIYDLATLEGATRMIDGGSQLAVMFQAAARSAMVVGEFDMAKKLYEVLASQEEGVDPMETVDKSLASYLEKHRERFAAEAMIQAAEAKEDRLPRVKLETTQGDVIIELFIDQAPSTVANFIKLVESHFYDGLDFYQVVDHLFALTGDATGLGSGNSGKFVIDECDRPDARRPFRGSLLMAKIPIGENGEFIPNSASTQFAISFLPLAVSADNQTVFGRVIEGMDAISRMRRIDPSKEKDKNAILLPPDRIIEATVIRRPEVLPEIEYFTPPGR
ncbi:peptidylprolyl isomerase [Rubripirellula reticaptiva]|uniref:peptidylprolyl isomerase n=1 Tax=Rubripirellula reticaptiva TaxID=2528013 RepID=A0A5C6EHF5_9BACT|nr:peptidylprolyl isomerase [Rubripirellula reticaptiva]TWU47111.1 putative peptidyl-prolyl cis-trans isomerase [Rubripirellula reticaptiva]